MSKLKASETAITSLALDPLESKYIVCSSKTITVWDLDNKQKLKV